MTRAEKKTFLEKHGWVCGLRDTRLNRAFAGRFMCAEPYDDDDTPTDDARNGPWCIVGDNLDPLIDEAYGHLGGIRK